MTPSRSRPARPVRPIAVRVGVAVLGRVEVDHVRDLGDVDAAGGDVGRDQHGHLAALEAGEGLLALRLRLVAVHGDGLDVAGAELLDEPVGAALGADEDERPAAVAGVELVDEQVDLGGLARRLEEAMADRRTPTLRLRSVDVPAGVAGVSRGELRRRHPRGWRRRRVSGDLAGILADDPVDGGLEAHVEHPVGLVEDEASGRWRGVSARRWIRSSSRPGVATRMCAFGALRICGSMPTPP